MNRKAYVLIGLVVLIIICLAFYIKLPTILRLLGTEAVNFCGTVYQSERVFIDGVDIIKRIADIGTEHPEHGICNNVKSNTQSYVTIKIEPDLYFTDAYALDTSAGLFLVNPKANGLWQSSPYGETRIGDLHKKSE